MGGNPSTFKPDSPLTQGTLSELVAGLTEQEPTVPVAPEATVTMTALDASLVKALGLDDAAAAFTSGARSAGLAPPSRFGNEVVARLLGLRTNHPAGQDSLELLPKDTATRAEAAFSAARILGFGEWETEGVRDAVADLRATGLDARGSARSSGLRSPSSAFRTSGAGRARSRRPPSAAKRRAASTAPASSGASTSSRRTRALPS